MMKQLTTSILTMFTAVAFTALGAGVDGKWTGQAKLREKSVPVTFNLKSDGAAITGDVSLGGRKAKPMEIYDGKVDGNQVSFKTKRETKKGVKTMNWSGTLDGDALKMTLGAGKKAKRTSAFTLNRVVERASRPAMPAIKPA